MVAVIFFAFVFFKFFLLFPFEQGIFSLTFEQGHFLLFLAFRQGIFCLHGYHRVTLIGQLDEDQ
jgi:hypothetical protein